MKITIRDLKKVLQEEYDKNDRVLLKKYLKSVLENDDPDMRVPNQLLPADGDEDNVAKAKEDNEEDRKDEFSSAGGVAGFTGPLGVSPKDINDKE